MVNYIDQRPAAEKSAQLFFVVFEWKDPFIQKVQDVSIISDLERGLPTPRHVGASLQAVLIFCHSADFCVFCIYDIHFLYHLCLIDLIFNPGLVAVNVRASSLFTVYLVSSVVLSPA